MSRTLSRVQRDYDLGVVINPDVGDDQARAIVERITQTIATNGGQLVRVNAVGRRRLAYPIEHHRDGLYFFFDMSLPPEASTEVERTLRVNEDIIRHLMLVRDPRLVVQQRQREAEREAEREAAAQGEREAAARREAEREAVATAAPVAAVAEAAPVAAVVEAAEEATSAPAPAAEETVSEETADEDGDEAEDETQSDAEANVEA
ncbi:MAG TPA: 30S ribosomal protein S6 [Ktedonobacterales bacterium]|nr:30S ribosomal protein S6 [Ktedonobacterales bacterium]